MSEERNSFALSVPLAGPRPALAPPHQPSAALTPRFAGFVNVPTQGSTVSLEQAYTALQQVSLMCVHMTHRLPELLQQVSVDLNERIKTMVQQEVQDQMETYSFEMDANMTEIKDNMHRAMSKLEDLNKVIIERLQRENTDLQTLLDFRNNIVNTMAGMKKRMTADQEQVADEFRQVQEELGEVQQQLSSLRQHRVVKHKAVRDLSLDTDQPVKKKGKTTAFDKAATAASVVGVLKQVFVELGHKAVSSLEKEFQKPVFLKRLNKSGIRIDPLVFEQILSSDDFNHHLEHLCHELKVRTLYEFLARICSDCVVWMHRYIRQSLEISWLCHSRVLFLASVICRTRFRLPEIRLALAAGAFEARCRQAEACSRALAGMLRQSEEGNPD